MKPGGLYAEQFFVNPTELIK